MLEAFSVIFTDDTNNEEAYVNSKENMRQQQVKYHENINYFHTLVKFRTEIRPYSLYQTNQLFYSKHLRYNLAKKRSHLLAHGSCILTVS